MKPSPGSRRKPDREKVAGRPATFLGTPGQRAAAAIAAATLVGAGVRLASLGRLGLVHFDEGIYAMAGLWGLSPGGLRAIDPLLVPYAPPGFPILVGLVYRILGVSDVAAILVSVALGVLTIPLVGWITARTFGPPAGAAASALAALSGPHVAFSRMALTDASFLLVWLLAIEAGRRFVERPRLVSALALGLAVGVAQNFKYNGWLSGAIAALALLVGLIPGIGSRPRPKVAVVAGLLASAALTSAIVYAPWFAFVEAHGSYSGLLAHHRAYTGGLASWPLHWRIQIAQGVALSGGPMWGASAGLLAWTAIRFTERVPSTPRIALARLAAGVGESAALAVSPMLGWWAGLGWMLGPWQRRSASMRLLGAWWITLAALTPFYHPYARLWLPLHAAGWLVLGSLLAALDRRLSGPTPGAEHRKDDGRAVAVSGLIVACMAALWVWDTPRPRPLAGLLGPSDSLRDACRELARAIPEGVPGVRILARPPVRFYLALSARGALRSEPDLATLVGPGDPREWIVADEAALLQERDAASALRTIGGRYEQAGSWPTELNPPTLLDADPGAARRPDAERRRMLYLFRPRPSRVSP